MPPTTVEDPVAAGWDALGQGDWRAARGHFESALEREESPEAWDGLGWAAWWGDDEATTFRARETAYKGFRARKDPSSAARVAAWLAVDFREFRGDHAVAQGWITRARRLLEGMPESEDLGWVTILEAVLALNLDGDVERAGALAGEVARMGRELGTADLEAIGLAIEGLTLVARGEVSRGMRQLDEATAIAASEDLRYRVAHGWSLCCMISACEGVGDFPRAAQWCAATREYVERWGGQQLLGVCRSAYGRVLATGGDWSAGEAEMTAALRDLERVRPGMAGGALVRLGELRARQGRPEEARQLFEQAAPHPLATVGLGGLALDAGEPEGAADAAARVLRNLPPEDLLDRLPALELLAHARAALGDHDGALEACADLGRTAGELGTPSVLGRAHLAAGEAAAARGDHDEARRACEDALDRFAQSSAPYEAALARLALSRALAGLGREGPAAAEATAARQAFAALGATRDFDRTGDGGAPPDGELSARELEVLRLVAQGLSDADIAERLVLSPHTVHRHVANIRVKLGQPSRAAAVAHAARDGLL